jgi:hypothetical protein
MADNPSRIVTNRAFAGDEKAEMLKAIQDLQREIRALSASVSEKIGSRNSDSDYEDSINRSFKKQDKKNESIAERADRIVKEFKETREKDRKEMAAQIQAQFNIMGERMKHPFRSGASSALTGLGNSVERTRNHNFNNDSGIDSGNKAMLGGALKGLGKLIAPKMEAEKGVDHGQANTNSPSDQHGPRGASSSAHSGNKKQLSILRNMLKKSEGMNEEEGKTLQYMIDQYEKQDEKEELTRRKTMTVKELAAEKEQAQYDKENDEKKEILANAESKVKIMKEKYMSGDFVKSARWLASDTLTSLGGSVERERNKGFNDNSGIDQKNKALVGKGLKLAGARIKPWMPSGPPKQDAIQENPNGPKDESLGGTIAEDVTAIKKAVVKENAMESNEDSELQDIADQLMGVEKKEESTNDQADELETSLSKLYHYVKGGDLVEDIVAALKEEKKSEKKDDDEKQEESREESEGEDGEEGEGKGKGGKWGKMKGRLAKMDSGAGARTPGMKWMGKGPGIGGAAGGAMAAAAVVALGAASAYTIYETAKTANAITEGKANVRDSTKGSAEAASLKNQEKYTKDSKEVQASAPRYEKAGLSKDEALSTSLAERQNSKMLASAASMGGIFTAAKMSTDFRSSEGEINKLDEGEKLADTIRSGLQGLNQRLQDPNSVSKMSPEEIKSVSNQAKITLKQIGDLQKTWEESKKLGHGMLDSQWLKDGTMVADGDAVVGSLVDSGKDIEASFDAWEKEMASGAKTRSGKKKDDKKDKKDKKDDKKGSSKLSTLEDQKRQLEEAGRDTGTFKGGKLVPEKGDKNYDERMEEESTPEAKRRNDAIDEMKGMAPHKKRYSEMTEEEQSALGNKRAAIEHRDRMADMADAANSGEQPDSTDTAKERFGDLDSAIDNNTAMKPPPGYVDPSSKLKDNLKTVDNKDSKPHIEKVGEELKGAITDQNKNISEKLDALTEQVAKLADKKDPTPAYQYPIHPNPSFTSIQTTSKGL